MLYAVMSLCCFLLLGPSLPTRPSDTRGRLEMLPSPNPPLRVEDIVDKVNVDDNMDGDFDDNVDDNIELVYRTIANNNA